MIDIASKLESSVGSATSLAVASILGIILLVLLMVKTTKRPPRFPPGPPCLPVIGNILDLAQTNMETLMARWAKKYGDVFSIKIGERWMVVLNHQEVIKEAILKQGVEFAGRPQFYSAEIATDGFKDITFGTFSNTWKLHRKLAHSAIRYFASGENLNGLVHSVFPQVEKLLGKNQGKPIDPKVMITLTLYNIFSKMCFGQSYQFDDPRFLEWVFLSQEIGEKIGFGLVADYFSWAKYIPSGGPGMIRKFRSRFFDVSQVQMLKHQKEFNPDKVKDFCDLLLLAQKEARDNKSDNIDDLTDTHLVQTVNDVFIAGIETSMQRLYWTLALMAEYRDIQAQVQEEIDRVVGRDRNPVIDDRGTLPFTEATLYEIMRYSTVGPIGVPHATTTDTEFRGYLIPKDTTIVLNHYSMHFDPREWEDPHSFKPEHFLDGSGTVRQHPPSFLPFGAGRRSCLGEAVAKADLFLISTWLLQNYTFSKAPGKEKETLQTLQPQSAAGRVLKNYEIMITKRD